MLDSWNLFPYVNCNHKLPLIKSVYVFQVITNGLKCDSDDVDGLTNGESLEL